MDKALKASMKKAKAIIQAKRLRALKKKVGAYPSMRQASISAGVDPSNLHNMVNGKRPIPEHVAKWAGYRRLPAEQRFVKEEK